MRGMGWWRRVRPFALGFCVLAVIAAGFGSYMRAERVRAETAAVVGAGLGAQVRLWQRNRWATDGAWFRRLIYLYASGDPDIQREAHTAAEGAGLDSTQADLVPAAVRAAWVRLMTSDPATVGRPQAVPSYWGQQIALENLRDALRGIAGGHYDAFLKATDEAYGMVSSSSWLQSRSFWLHGQPLRAGRWALVYATSFSIPGDSSAYVALPDTYLKFSTLGWVSSIPSFYQPFYIPGGTAVRYTVDVSLPNGSASAAGAPVTDVGPWNEDDNWWDPTKTEATVPSTCPVSGTRVSAYSLTSAAVDGICPDGANYRRVYYYMLYKHIATPFFQPSAYAPTGSFADASAWPTPLPLDCPESSAASVNDDAVACARPFAGYNTNASSWLRNGSYNAPVLNQAGIDLGPGVDAALGWTWPSSGFVVVNLTGLP